jgi:hypothetical protein
MGRAAPKTQTNITRSSRQETGWTSLPVKWGWWRETQLRAYASRTERVNGKRSTAGDVTRAVPITIPTRSGLFASGVRAAQLLREVLAKNEPIKVSRSLPPQVGQVGFFSSRSRIVIVTENSF